MLSRRVYIKLQASPSFLASLPLLSLSLPLLLTKSPIPWQMSESLPDLTMSDPLSATRHFGAADYLILSAQWGRIYILNNPPDFFLLSVPDVRVPKSYI